MLQDELGYMWIATNEGLQRFDGIRYKSFIHGEDAGSLPSNLTWQLAVKSKHELWVLTVDGHAGIFNTHNFRFTEVPVDMPDAIALLSGTPLKKLVTDSAGNCFLLLPGKMLLKYNPQLRMFTKKQNLAVFSQPMQIHAFAADPHSSKYWFATEEQGLAVVDGSSGNVYTAANHPPQFSCLNLLKDKKDITSIYLDQRGRIWIAGNENQLPVISCYDPLEKRLILNNYSFKGDNLGFHLIRSFYEQKDGTIWITGQQIFARFREKERDFEHVYNGNDEEHGIDYIMVTGLAEDRDHGLWACTANNGLYQFNPSREFFQNISYRSHLTGKAGAGAPVSFIRDKDGSILTGIREDGFYRFDSNMRQVPLAIQGIPENNRLIIWDMKPSADSTCLWFAAYEGIYRYNPQHRSAVFYHSPVLQKKTVRCIRADKSGTLWLGTQEGGLYTWKPGVQGATEPVAFAGVPSARIFQLVSTSAGELWVSVYGDGIYVLDEQSHRVLRHFSKTAPGALHLPEQTVQSVLPYNDSLVIIGTLTRLLVYNSRSQVSAPIGNQLSGFIASMEKDSAGNLWVSTTTSLYRVTLHNNVFLRMDRDDGLENDYFLLGASLKLPRDQMLFGAYGQLVLFKPSALRLTALQPELKFTEVYIGNTEVPADSVEALQQLVLKPGQNAVTVYISAMSYNAGYTAKYRMKGLDKEWHSMDPDYRLAYSWLPAGSYVLEIETMNPDGNKTAAIRLPVRVREVFWKTWWFYGLIALAAIFLFYLFDRQRLLRLRATDAIRADIAGNLHKEVHDVLGNIHILSELAGIKASSDPAKSQEFISQIRSKSGQMISAIDDMLWSIDPLNDSIGKNFTRMQEYVAGLNASFATHIVIGADEKIFPVKMDMQQRHIFLSSFRDTLMTVINAGGSDISVNLNMSGGALCCDMSCPLEETDLAKLNNFAGAHQKAGNKDAGAFITIDVNKSFVLILLRVMIVSGTSGH